MKRKTPFHRIHQESRAKLIDFFGWEMPLSYSGVLDEHEAVRSAAGLFDISHMGRLRFSGKNAPGLLQRLLTRDVEKLAAGSAAYSVICNPEGGILDDVVVYRESAHEFLVVVNAGNREKIWAWCGQNAGGQGRESELAMGDQTDQLAMLALQGPAAYEILGETRPAKAWRFERKRLFDREVMLAHTGYTGEPGVEIFIEAAAGPPLWRKIMEKGEKKGLKPAGLGARDTLRLEKGYPLYGNDIDEQTTPLEAGLGWVVDMAKPDFIGKAALQKQQQSGLEKKLVGFRLLQPGVPRKGYTIYSNGKQIGKVTSGNMSPMLHQGIGMGYVCSGYWEPETELLIEIRNKVIPAVVVKPPFYGKKSSK